MNKALVIYDGDCGLCEKSRRLFKKLDFFDRFEWQPLQNSAIYANHPTITQESCKKEVKLISLNGEISGGADAIIKICLKLPLAIPFGILFWPPPMRQLARWLYKKVADNRYKLSKFQSKSHSKSHSKSQCNLENKEP